MTEKKSALCSSCRQNMCRAASLCGAENGCGCVDAMGAGAEGVLARLAQPPRSLVSVDSAGSNSKNLMMG